jgi:hypothetical protein
LKTIVPVVSDNDSANQQVMSGDLTLANDRSGAGEAPARGLGVSPNSPISSPKTGGSRGFK